jgi:serine protease Do
MARSPAVLEIAMTRLPFLPLAILLLAGSARAQPPAGGDVPALVAKAEPAVASVLVSRSPVYHELGLDRNLKGPGKVLGDLRGLDPDHRLYRKLALHDVRHIPEAFGSGLLIDPSGLVLTNYHVVQGATKLFVRWPGAAGGGSYADIHAADPRCDLAVLRLIDPGKRPLPTIRFGAADDLHRGQSVVAICNPYAAGMIDGQPSVSVGIINSVRRRFPKRSQPEQLAANPLYQFGLLLQTDAQLPLGCSGGALLDANGDCIGITTALAALAGSDSAGGFAFPVTSRMQRLIDTLRRGEEIEYGMLGINLQTPDFRGEVRIKDVYGRTPAEKAGLVDGDALLEIDSTPIQDSQDVMLALAPCQAGDRIQLKVRSVGSARPRRVEATLVKFALSDSFPEKSIVSSLGRRPIVGGLRVDYTSTIAKGVAIPPGVVVSSVEPGSKAEKLKLAPYDIITKVNDRPVDTPERFYQEIDRDKGPIVLTVPRRDEERRIHWQ